MITKGKPDMFLTTALKKNTYCTKIHIVNMLTPCDTNHEAFSHVFLPERVVSIIERWRGQHQGIQQKTHVLMPHMTPAARRFRATEENQQCIPTLRLAHDTGAGQYESDVKRVAGHFGFPLTGWLSWANTLMSGALGVIPSPKKSMAVSA